MKAKKENKVYTINTEQEKQRYLKEGYDIYDDKGNVQAYSPLKKIAYSEYVSAVKEIESLRASLAETRAENERLRAENSVLQTAKQESPKKATDKKASD